MDSKHRNQNLILIYLIIFAYLFSIGARMILAYRFSGQEELFWNGQAMLTTNDAYFYASGAQKWLEGTLEHNTRVPGIFSSAIVTIAAYTAKYSSFSLETITFYMPAVISSLIVVPIILIGRLFSLLPVGFFAALLASVGWSYYARTKLGYFDTDMFSVLLLMFILYLLFAAIRRESIFYALLSSLVLLVYPYFYNQGLSLLYAIEITFILYVIIFHNKSSFTYPSIILIAIGCVSFDFWGQAAAIFLLYMLFTKNIITARQSLYFAILLLPVFIIKEDVLGVVLVKVTDVLDRGVIDQGLKYLQVSQTIREAGLISYDTVMQRLSGSAAGTIIAIVGYGLLIKKHREFLLALPLIGLGVFSLWGGLRFTMFPIPIIAFSAVYLIHLLASNLHNKKLYYGSMGLLTAALIYPNMEYIVKSKIKTVLNHKEAEALTQLKMNSSSRDYVIAWWDYGYPIWYYADKNTLIDGGYNSEDNYIISRILLTDKPKEAARLARLAVETYISNGYTKVANTLFKNAQGKQIVVEDYLQKLYGGKIDIPTKSREIFIYLPYDMIGMLPTIKQFSNLDLNTGKALGKPFIYISESFKRTRDEIIIGNNISILIRKAKLRIGNKTIPIGKYFTISSYPNGKIKIDKKVIDPSQEISIIYLSDHKMFIVLDEEYLNSLFIQMLLFDNFNEELFEPIVKNRDVKIFKLKI